MSQIDELLIEAKRVCGERWQKAPEYPWEVAAQFGAEVERLRFELQKVQNAASTARAQQALAEAENAELRDKANELSDISTEHARAFQEKRKEAEALKARLAWFEGFAKQAHDIADPVTGDLRAWEREHPKPE